MSTLGAAGGLPAAPAMAGGPGAALGFALGAAHGVPFGLGALAGPPPLLGVGGAGPLAEPTARGIEQNPIKRLALELNQRATTPSFRLLMLGAGSFVFRRLGTVCFGSIHLVQLQEGGGVPEAGQ